MTGAAGTVRLPAPPGLRSALSSAGPSARPQTAAHPLREAADSPAARQFGEALSRSAGKARSAEKTGTGPETGAETGPGSAPDAQAAPEAGAVAPLPRCRRGNADTGDPTVVPPAPHLAAPAPRPSGPTPSGPTLSGPTGDSGPLPAAEAGEAPRVLVQSPPPAPAPAAPAPSPAVPVARLDAGMPPSPSTQLDLPGDRWRAEQVVINRQENGLAVTVDLGGGRSDRRAITELEERLRRRGLAATVRPAAAASSRIAEAG